MQFSVHLHERRDRRTVKSITFELGSRRKVSCCICAVRVGELELLIGRQGEESQHERHTSCVSSPHPSLAAFASNPLAHFTQTFLPLIDQLTNLATGPGSNPSIAKV